jgi:tetratricopeptide (TPR) repeat protein
MKSQTNINTKKLAIELLITLSIIFIISLHSFLPWFFAQPIPWANSDPYDPYKALLHDVEQFDYYSGDHAAMRSRLDTAVSSINSDPVKYYFNLKAKALYYYHTGDHDTSISTLKEAINYAPTHQERADTYDLFVKNYSAINSLAETNYYEALRDAATSL